MSEEGDTFWVSLAEKFFGVLLNCNWRNNDLLHSNNKRTWRIQRILRCPKRNHGYYRSVSAFG